MLALPLSAQIGQSSGSVTGVVRLPDGMPAANIRVAAVRAEGIDAVKSMASLTQTDAMGRFRLENIPAGRYYIAAGNVDFPTYYPGSLIPSQGTVVSITSASSIADISFVIQEPSTRAPRQTKNPLLPGPPTFPLQKPPAIPQFPAQALGNVALTLKSLNARLTAPGAWWTNTGLVSRLGLTADQMKKIEGIFDQHRQTIVQDKANLEQEEAALARMLDADPMESSKNVSAQIDKVIQARGQMERTTSNMTLEMRQALTRTQWTQLQTEMPQVLTSPIQTPGPLTFKVRK
jgi:Spy/CpxP family protein refolding chaperone